MFYSNKLKQEIKELKEEINRLNKEKLANIHLEEIYSNTNYSLFDLESDYEHLKNNKEDSYAKYTYRVFSRRNKIIGITKIYNKYYKKN